MTNDYHAENVAKYIEDFVKHEENFDDAFFNQLSCLFTTVALMCNIDADTSVCDDLIFNLWADVYKYSDSYNNGKFGDEDYDDFYNEMVKHIV